MINTLQQKIAEQTIRHLILPMIDNYAGPNQENLVNALNRNTDLAPIIRDNWDQVAPPGLNLGYISIFAKNSTTKNAITTREVAGWLTKEKPHLARIIAAHPNGNQWLERNVEQIKNLIL